MTALPDGSDTKPRVLLVDDERSFLDALAVNLKRRFEVITAGSGAEGLRILASDPTIAVVVSDMRMPELSGAQWLAQARSRGHDATRIVLTGYADLASAMDAVNHGHIFRFLTKPCPKAELESAIDAAIVHRQISLAERDLLENTLRGSIKALTDILALTNPTAFGRANRIRTYVLRIAAAIGLQERWQVEVAAMLAPIGYTVLPDAVVAKIEGGQPLSDDERRQASRIPEITDEILSNIPRLEDVRRILEAQVVPEGTSAATHQRRLNLIGARVLHAATELERRETAGDPDPIATMLSRGGLDPLIALAFEKLAAEGSRASLSAISIDELRVGMVLGEDLKLVSGMVLVARGYEVTTQFLEKVADFPEGTICEPVRVVVAP